MLQDWVVLADKNGDVYKLGLKEKTQTKPILGRVHILLYHVLGVYSSNAAFTIFFLKELNNLLVL